MIKRVHGLAINCNKTFHFSIGKCFYKTGRLTHSTEFPNNYNIFEVYVVYKCFIMLCFS